MFGKWRHTAREKAEYNDEPMISYDYQTYDFTALTLHRAEWYSYLKTLCNSYDKEVRKIGETFAEQLEGNAISVSFITFGEGFIDDEEITLPGTFAVTDAFQIADYVVY